MTSITVKRCLTLRDKSIGLLGKNEIETIYFKTRFGIHTFFMKFPIDIIILDNGNRVVKIKKVKQNRIFLWNPKFENVLETKEGTIKKLDIKLGTKIELIFKP